VLARRRPEHDVDPSCEDFDEAGAEKTAKPEGDNSLINKNKLPLFYLGLSRPGRRRTKLTVFTPQRFAVLAGPRNTGGQTMPVEQIPL
jgi:hypothetical protein